MLAELSALGRLAKVGSTTMKGESSFVPAEFTATEFGTVRAARYAWHREHGMGAILNGIALHGSTATRAAFLIFGATPAARRCASAP
ncbi:hypothetical protein ACFQX7_10125 [Luedemannella flava]